MDEEVLRELSGIAEKVVEDVENGEIPELKFRKRGSSNIEKEDGIWVLGDETKTQSGSTVSGAESLLKKMYVVSYLANQVGKGKSSTLRELYYVSESWDNDRAEFDRQDESNTVIEELEVITGMSREQFNMRPEESGATLLGPLEIVEETRRGQRNIHCQEDIGEGGYQIPSDPKTVNFKDCDAGFVLAVETGGMRDRLVENGFDEDYNALIVHLKGQPGRSTRIIINRLRNELDLPVTVFTDADPWSYRIFSSVAFGSIKSAHMSHRLATQEARFIGIRPTDIVEYDLPTDPLSDADVNALQNELEDPRFQDETWQSEIRKQLDIGRKAEQQALASQGLDFVTKTYLPERLSEMGIL